MFPGHMVRTSNPWNEHLGTINPKPPATRALGGANHVSPRSSELPVSLSLN